jgi:hypothetical protein
MYCLRSLGGRDRGFEFHSEHGCFDVCVRSSVFVLSCVQVEALRRADQPSKESYRLWMIKKLRNEPCAPKVGASSQIGAKRKKKTQLHLQLRLLFTFSVQLPGYSWSTNYCLQFMCCTWLHSFTSQKIVLIIVTAMGTSTCWVSNQ